MDCACFDPDDCDCVGYADTKLEGVSRKSQIISAGARWTRMQSENLIKCAHESCRCLVEVEDQFCSAVCGDVKQTQRDPCPCGHPECVGTEEAAESDELEESTEVS
jgi:hypothetical protein